MTGQKRHRALIRWSPEQERLGLPSSMRGIDPAWISPTKPVQDDGWSLVYEFDRAPMEQGNPSAAYVHFPIDDAPHEQLVAGTILQLFEPATRRYATIEILD
jgi:hypothetical protein